MYTGGRSFHWKYFQVLAQLQECAATYTDSGRRQGSSLFAAAATWGRTRTLAAATCGRCQCMCSPIPATCGRQLKLDKFARFFAGTIVSVDRLIWHEQIKHSCCQVRPTCLSVWHHNGVSVELMLMLRSHTRCFFHWYPPKKYGKPWLGESTLT